VNELRREVVPAPDFLGFHWRVGRGRQRVILHGAPDGIISIDTPTECRLGHSKSQQYGSYLSEYAAFDREKPSRLPCFVDLPKLNKQAIEQLILKYSPAPDRYCGHCGANH
jgi:hypothetical protein